MWTQTSTPELLPGHRHGHPRVDEPLAESGSAVGPLLRVVPRLLDTRRLEQVLGQHQVLTVAEDLVGEHLAVVAGRVGRHLEPREAPADQSTDGGVTAPENLEHVVVPHRRGDGVVVLAADLLEDVVGPAALLGLLQDVAGLLVDGVARRAEVGLDGVARLHRHAGVPRRHRDGGGEGDHVGVVAEAGAAGLVGVDDVLDTQLLEEPLGGRLDARVLGRDQAAPEELHAAGDGGDVRCGGWHALITLGEQKRAWQLNGPKVTRQSGYFFSGLPGVRRTDDLHPRSFRRRACWSCRHMRDPIRAIHTPATASPPAIPGPPRTSQAMPPTAAAPPIAATQA
jgi:hypothetical protein